MYDMVAKKEAPLTAMTVFLSGDPTEGSSRPLSLRGEHTHFFSLGNDAHGGHYHGDVLGSAVDDVEYDAYLLPNDAIYKLDLA